MVPALLVVSSWLFGRIPVIGGMSRGDGRYSPMASSRGCMPLFFNAVPQSTGTISLFRVAFLRACFISSLVMVSSSRYLLIRASSVSATFSISLSL